MASELQRVNRMRHGYYGQGDYGLLGMVPKAIGLIGRGIRAARAARRGWKGQGDYEAADAGTVVESAPTNTYGPPVDNQLISGGNPPISVNTGDDLTGDICWAHTEFVSNVEVLTSGTTGS